MKYELVDYIVYSCLAIWVITCIVWLLYRDWK